MHTAIVAKVRGPFFYHRPNASVVGRTRLRRVRALTPQSTRGVLLLEHLLLLRVKTPGSTARTAPPTPSTTTAIHSCPSFSPHSGHSCVNGFWRPGPGQPPSLTVRHRCPSRPVAAPSPFGGESRPSGLTQPHRGLSLAILGGRAGVTLYPRIPV